MKRMGLNASALLLAGVLSSGLAAAKEKTAKPRVAAPATSAPAAPQTVARDADVKNGVKISGAPGIAELTIYPRVSGSTSTIPVGQLLAARALGLSGELRRVPAEQRWDEREPSLKLTFALDADPGRLKEYSTLAGRNRHLQTNQSYNALANGATDLILVAREPSSDEIEVAKEHQVTFDVRPVALDALVFVAHRKNPLSGLSLDQIRAIYGGQSKNWKALGGADEEIFAVTRDRNSGSQELMKKLVMQDRAMIEGHERMAMTMGGTLDMVERRDNALAYSVYYYERIMAPREEIKPLAVNGVLPNSRTIADKTYPLVEPVYVVTRQDITPDGPAATLRDWLLSDEGQKLIEQSGYVPVVR